MGTPIPEKGKNANQPLERDAEDRVAQRQRVGMKVTRSELSMADVIGTSLKSETGRDRVTSASVRSEPQREVLDFH